MIQSTANRLNETLDASVNLNTNNYIDTNASESLERQNIYSDYPSLNDNTVIPEYSNDKIPLNSETITMDMSTSRFSSALWYNNVQRQIITLAGLGGIGSFLALLLSRMKPAHIIIYDNDVIEYANMSGQFYSVNDIAVSKAHAMTTMMHNYSNYYHITSNNKRFTESSEATDIMMCGFDNMAARKIFYEVWKNHVMSISKELRNNCLFLDGRIKC